MSLIKKSDVKNHLWTGAGGKVLPFGPRSQSDATGYSNDGVPDAPGNVSSSEANSNGQSSVLPAGTANSVEAAAGSEQMLKPGMVKTSQA
jgi:hypothetical protein